MAHLKNILTISVAAFLLAGCYTQIKSVDDRPSRYVSDRYSDDFTSDQQVYDLGYEDGFYDAELYFRDFNRYRWHSTYGIGYGFHHRPYYSRGSYSFYMGHGYHNWGWNDPWYYHHYGFYGHSRYHRYPSHYGWGWGGSHFYGPNYVVVYNFRNITGVSSQRIRTTRGTGSVTATRSARVADQSTRGTVNRGTTVNRSGATNINRGTSVTRTSTGTNVRSTNRGTTSTRSSGTTVRRTSSGQSSGTVNRSGTTSRSSGTVNRSGTTTRSSSGTVNRRSSTTRSSGSVNRSGSTTRSSGTVNRSSSSGSSRSSSGGSVSRSSGSSSSSSDNSSSRSRR